MKDNLKEKIHRITCLVSDIDSSYHRASVKMGVSDSVIFILYMLYIRDHQCSLNEIYTLLGISKQTINSAIRKLEKENIIYLENLDGKSKKVCSTEEGKKYIKKTAGRLYAAEVNTFKEWSEPEIDRFIEILEKYNELFKKQVELL